MMPQQSASVPVGMRAPVGVRDGGVEDEGGGEDERGAVREDLASTPSVSPSPGAAALRRYAHASATASVPGRVPLLVGSYQTGVFAAQEDGPGRAAAPEREGSFTEEASVDSTQSRSTDDEDDLEVPLVDGARRPRAGADAGAEGEWTPVGGQRGAPAHWLTPDLAKGLLYGLINFVVMVPTLVSYAGIVLRAPAYKAHPELMPKFVSLMYLSSACQQVVFSLLSPLTFAIGQVQDVGLILISAIATDVAARGSAAGLGIDAIVATVLTFSTLFTLVVGILIVLTGKLGLARYIQMLPLRCERSRIAPSPRHASPPSLRPQRRQRRGPQPPPAPASQSPVVVERWRLNTR